jgi:hypothetical protein
MTFKLNLDDILDDIFFELEEVSEGYRGHEVIVKDVAAAKEAAEKLCNKMVPFFTEHFEGCGEEG